MLQAFSPKYFNGEAELASSAIHLCNVIKDIYDLFLKEKDRHPGKVPVLSCIGSQPMKDRHGTNYRPIIVIINWVDRPSELLDSNSGSPAPPPPPPPEPRRTDPAAEEPLF